MANTFILLDSSVNFSYKGLILIMRFLSYKKLIKG